MKHNSQKRFIKQQIQKNIALNAELEEELKKQREKRHRGNSQSGTEYDTDQSKRQGGGTSQQSAAHIAEGKQESQMKPEEAGTNLPTVRMIEAGVTEQAKVPAAQKGGPAAPAKAAGQARGRKRFTDRDFGKLMSINTDQEYSKANLVRAGVLLQQTPEARPAKKSLAGRKGPKPRSQRPTSNEQSFSLDSIQILESEDDEFGESIGPEMPARFFSGGADEADGVPDIQNKIDADLQERRFIKQGKFISQFMQELRINEKFDKLQKFAQNRIFKDDFVRKIIFEGTKGASAASYKRQQTELKSRKQGGEQSAGKKGTSPLRSDGFKNAQNKAQNFQNERRSYGSYLKTIMHPVHLNSQLKKQVFKLRAEHLFEIVYALLGQMFLTQIDTVDQLTLELRNKFPSQSNIMQESYINQDRKDKDASGPLKSKAASTSFSPHRKSSVVVRPSRPAASKSPQKAAKVVDLKNQLGNFLKSQVLDRYNQSTLKPPPEVIEPRKDQHTQTGETYDEFILLASVRGIDNDLLFVPGEERSTNLIKLHKLDYQNQKLVKIELNLKPKEAEDGNRFSQGFELQAQEYLPESIVENFLPFNCVMKLDEMTQRVPANLFGYENSRADRNARGPITEIQLASPEAYSSNRPLKMLPGYTQNNQGQRPRSPKGKQGHAAGHALKVSAHAPVNLAEAQEVLNEYFKLLTEAKDKFEFEMKKSDRLLAQVRSSSTSKFLPAQHLHHILQIIEATVQTQLLAQHNEAHEKAMRQQVLKKYELSLDRLNLKVKQLTAHLQQLEIQRLFMENAQWFQDFKKKDSPEDRARWKAAERVLLRAHTDGFNLGLTHGKMVGSLVERTLMINQGQLNGVKHGWMSGFEAGQMSGIKRVFVEAYMNNVNLYEKLDVNGSECSVLENLDIRALKKESMNEFNKVFKNMKTAANQSNRFKGIVEKFKALPTGQKLQHKKVGKRVLVKYIYQIYQEKQLQKTKLNRDISLIEAMTKHIAINYGNNNVTDSRMFRIFSSALFNAASVDSRSELEKYLNKVEKGHGDHQGKGQSGSSAEKVRINY